MFRCQSISDDALRPLAGLTGLRQVSLRDMPILGEGLVHLRGKSKLAVLRLNETDVGDAGLENLKDLASLVRLELRRTQTGDAGLKSLVALVRLETLDWRIPALPMQDLRSWPDSKKLQRLNLDNNPGITDAAIDRLAKLANLKSLRSPKRASATKG